MKIKHALLQCLSILVLAMLLTVSSNAQTSKNAAKLKSLYLNRDYETCYETGRNLSAKDDTESRAWTLVCMASLNFERTYALKEAESFAKDFPEDTWALFTLADAQQKNYNREDALKTIEKALIKSPDNEEVILKKLQILHGLGKSEEADKFVIANENKITDKVRLNNSLAIDLRNRAGKDTKNAEQLKQQANAKLTESAKMNPQSASVLYLQGFYLNSEKKFDEAYPILKRAVAISSRNYEIRNEFWKSVNGLKSKTDDQKKAEFEADVKSYLISTNNSPYSLGYVLSKYDQLDNKEQRDFYENLIVQRYPNSKFDEEIVYQRINSNYAKYRKQFDSKAIDEMRFKRKSQRTPKETAVYEDYERKMKDYIKERSLALEEFVNRPKHFNEERLGLTYLQLIQINDDSKEITDEKFQQWISNALKYSQSNSEIFNTSISSAILTIKKTRPETKLMADAEKYARAGILEAEAKSKLITKPTAFNNPQYIQGTSSITLANVLIENGKFDEAENLLAKTLELSRDAKEEEISLLSIRDWTYLSYAKLYRAKKDYERAEEFYLKNASDDDNTEELFKKFYEEKGGKSKDFSAYYSSILEKIKVKSKAKIIATRIKNPRDLVSFSLKTIDDKTISSDQLKGKIIVINFWGAWCGPCVSEMPELQKLYKKYENDKDVAIITFDSGDELADVKKFIADKKYEFPVLIGDSYTSNIKFNGSTAFPTTLFVDKQGKISFIKIGATASLFEEFGWRIEALKADK